MELNKSHHNNRMRVFAEEYEACSCGNPKGIKNIICTTYNNLGICNVELVKQEILCENCNNNKK